MTYSSSPAPMLRRLHLFAFVLLAPLAAQAPAAEGQPETCAQIRARIGLPPLADPDLLRTLAARKDCQFTAAEVYLAAHGDKPLPKEEPKRTSREGKHHHHEHDDD